MDKRTHSIERRMRDAGVYDPDEFEAWMATRDWGWQRLERGDYGVSLDEAKILYTVEDPVRFCETFLREHNGDPYRFFDYQKPSIRAWDQDVVHEDGAEVGKTREIIAILLWGHITGFGFRLKGPSSLVGAPKQIFLDEIIDAMERQVGVFKAMPGDSVLKQVWIEPRRTPHTQLRLRSIVTGGEAALATIDFRPAGHDGDAFRGVHVTGVAIVEEAAKMKAKVQWTEFSRAMMPGCRFRYYSVPDGDRNTHFYNVCQTAVPNLPHGAEGTRKFHWPKTLMPAPFWSAERDRYFIKLYGGRDTPGYQRNVLGAWGDAEDPVFRWDVITPNLVDLPDYRRIVLTAEGSSGQLYVNVDRIELVVTAGKKSSQAHSLHDAVEDLQPFIGKDDDGRRTAWDALLAPHLLRIDPRGRHFIGGDLGERNDPTELIVSEQVGDAMVDVLRVKAKGLPYHAQTELIYQVDRACGHKAEWSIDMGNAGTAVVKDLLNLDRYADAEFDGRLVGVHFQEAMECIGEDGEALSTTDDAGDEEIIRAPAKHWATQCVVARLQVCGYRMAYDSDVISDYTSHTARSGTKWPIYAKKNDHTIDARRQQMLAVLRTMEPNVPDVFSVGVYRRHAA